MPKCWEHADRSAVATCSLCKHAICAECAAAGKAPAVCGKCLETAPEKYQHSLAQKIDFLSSKLMWGIVMDALIIPPLVYWAIRLGATGQYLPAALLALLAAFSVFWDVEKWLELRKLKLTRKETAGLCA